jgi:hypothetical protein
MRLTRIHHLNPSDMHSGSPEIAALERRYLQNVIGATSYREALQAFADQRR